MNKNSKENKEVRDFILSHVAANPATIGRLAVKKFGLSRSAIVGYMQRLVAQGVLEASGQTKARRYKLKSLSSLVFDIELSHGLAEDAIWRFRVLPALKGVKQNIVDICQYGFTEMLNNAIDHSVSAKATIVYEQTFTTLTMMISDQGVGIFEKIQKDFSLPDARTALLELAKGKLTSDKKNHAGEGIFFTSRMFDEFTIRSGRLVYARLRQDDNQWIFETEDTPDYTIGTTVLMQISTGTERTKRQVFDAYQKDGAMTLAYRKTHVPLKLSKYPDEQLVSRSQAKRVLTRFEEFTEVFLDFDGVKEIGQGFADEIFRVFKNQHPSITITAVRTTTEIDAMITHVQERGKELEG